MRKFNHFILENYSEKEKLVYLFNQLDISYHIPNEIVSKYWVRAYTGESTFYRNMNKDLRCNKIGLYLPYIHMMYEGVKLKSFFFKPESIIYRGAYFDKKEVSKLYGALSNKNPNLPGCLVYSKSFLSFTLDFNIAMKFKKNVLLIIENYKDELCNNCPGCASIKKFSFFKNEEEILIFPFSCFEINRISVGEEIEKNKRSILYI